MAITKINDTLLTNIGAAIRRKTGKPDLIFPGDMPAEIDGIKGSAVTRFDRNYKLTRDIASEQEDPDYIGYIAFNNGSIPDAVFAFVYDSNDEFVEQVLGFPFLESKKDVCDPDGDWIFNSTCEIYLNNDFHEIICAAYIGTDYIDGKTLVILDFYCETLNYNDVKDIIFRIVAIKYT